MSACAEQRITFPSSDGTLLEGALHETEGALAAVVLHPHPRYGGDMDNHVVRNLCATLAASGATTLRFNFRGTGASGGTFDDGRGEGEDARAAARYVRERVDRPLVLAGYSFGAIIAATTAASIAPAALILVSPPPIAFALSYDCPVLAVTGDRDLIAPAAALDNLPGATIAIAPAVDHGWWPGIEFLSDAVTRFVGDAGLAGA